ncbi:LysR family transcriptional regulator [Carnobacterium maltaromaticum]|uniref:LysR family transcriptional regulator n=1 Tax=Carnobacterium maltaromaticum TaxID=2751 RepID=A0AAW9JP19_CARML|nr:LysR family transcriptional regulator [Carnobacterium maltaromaticum]MDZ5757074.1 LysR family transcriptional regulator [Carnobacterium maltaromaticum]
MNLLSLKYFIAVAEYSSFTKASEHLYVTQPTLSRQILDLEDEFGVQFFIRARHSLTLTQAGILFLEEATEIVNKCDNLKEIVKSENDKKIGALSIGYQSFLNTKLMYNTIKSITKKYPRIDFSLLRGTPLELRHQLITGKCDVIFALNTCMHSIPNIECINLQENKLQIAVPCNHHLANYDSVNMKDIADEKFILLNRDISPFTVDYAISLCMKNGFSPNAAYYVNDAEKALLLVGTGKGITFLHSMNKATMTLDSYDIKLLTIENIDDELNFVLAYKKDNQNPLISILISELIHPNGE